MINNNFIIIIDPILFYYFLYIKYLTHAFNNQLLFIINFKLILIIPLAFPIFYHHPNIIYLIIFTLLNFHYYFYLFIIFFQYYLFFLFILKDQRVFFPTILFFLTIFVNLFFNFEYIIPNYHILQLDYLNLIKKYSFFLYILMFYF